jgi:putative toxin-antitoxin system antitoxin component (TIGR02293 family)
MAAKTSDLILKAVKSSTAMSTSRVKLKKSMKNSGKKSGEPATPSDRTTVSKFAVLPLRVYTKSMAEAVSSRKYPKLDYLKFNKIFEGRLTDTEIATTIFAERHPKAMPANLKQLGILETDRANRLARIVQLSDRVFGDASKSSQWLRKPRSKLAGQTPLELISTDAGAAVIEEMLHRIDHGMYA